MCSDLPSTCVLLFKALTWCLSIKGLGRPLGFEWYSKGRTCRIAAIALGRFLRVGSPHACVTPKYRVARQRGFKGRPNRDDLVMIACVPHL